MSTTTGRRRPGRPSKAEAGDTKAALLDAALRLFAQKGYAGTSVRAIAREVGLSESVLYAHFDGKRAIYDAAMALAGPQAAVVAADEAPQDPAAFVESFAARVLAAWDTPRSWQVVSLASRDGLIHDEALNAGIEDALAHLSEVFGGWLSEGRIRTDLGGPDDLAYALLAPMAHARVLWLHSDATPAQRERARHRMTSHAAFFARALQNPGDQAPSSP
ncbi:TetR/AcrR family transcriptional regulator [Nonomuraea sp. K274]|uniref:TetR/AcrR family transcriptional regulator n=1 Tax=Nonomuraea cypriaca TaxID=1187855 RepID=A0A931AFV9_9ACTN|nr:TetR/AcrR family transcriptional regulator [Nonomuraea cypriaca]MBF8188447.1 TetR/AcrR family transcriptional regulator [Nonomuraea cypriaca]